ncbi:ATP-dependent Clp protease proteolytic subunit [Enterococcus sp. BWB1-3]|uniref:ATP-dependent Clp protease proteolytic subunit n=1 Tax=unclassified Enterococcus TaxID=2608891 RepID=UPI001921C6D6|nr:MULTISPECIES: ATP-dependent Clp protease proteolytic subunit [unclassified Enterococcus]MBL1230435.1 ATP-dependent Clp protease proteolytic subunit [Enterococcus sp. BWB1-3]MCB5953359.1 ATP-dependent Clp protease proteolytic subunit [Enterococcus sp. BWT-B8]MCB5955725.1 ATP-dependent Clp protease proteolytic subunit [Enterococcus sp. CWB-B31]
MYRLEEEEKDTTPKNDQSMIMKKLWEERTILIYGEVTQDLAREVSSQLLLLAAMGDEPIKIFVNSPGGHVESGDTIHDMIQFVKPDVYVIGTGWVASAGVTIFLAADAKNRFCLPNTRFMIHQPAGGVQGQGTEIQIEAKEIVRMRERVNRMIAEATGQTYEQVAKDTDRNFWMSAEEAKEYGMISKIIKTSDEVL